MTVRSEAKATAMALDASEAVEAAAAAAQQLGFGGVLGYATGLAARAAGKAAAVSVGAAFATVQGLAYCGYIDVDWARVRRDVAKGLDRGGGDGDGELAPRDAVLAYERLRDVLTFNAPAGGGFGAGLALGVGVGRLAVASAAAATGGALLTGHRFATDVDFAAELERRLPALASELSKVVSPATLRQVSAMLQMDPRAQLDALREREAELRKELRAAPWWGGDRAARAAIRGELADVGRRKAELEVQVRALPQP